MAQVWVAPEESATAVRPVPRLLVSVGVVLSDVASITQLAVESASPARHSTVVEDGAGVVTSGRERYCCATRTEAAGERGCGFVRRCTITQLAVVSTPPARHSTVVKDGAGVVTPEESATAVRPYRVACERGRCFARCSTITQLAVVSFSPARHSTVVEDGAGVVITGRERYGCATCTEAAGERGRGFVRRSSITQSTVTSPSPARHSTVVKDGAGVVISGRERRFSIVKVGMRLENIERTIPVVIPFG